LTKFTFLDTVNRESNSQKITALINALKPFQDEMENIQRMDTQTIKISPEQLDFSRDISTFFAFAIAILILSGYEYKLVPHQDEEGRFD